jgi:hypothetical protein
MALGFQVQVNGETPVRAGDESVSVLTAIISYVASTKGIELAIGGLIAGESSKREHVEWLQRELAVGDRIVLTIVESADVDPPVRRREDPGPSEEQERRYYERLKARFEQR